ncbi:MAG: hypothetical protein ACTHNW_18240 [Mucilaginibacter sp.]
MKSKSLLLLISGIVLTFIACHKDHPVTGLQIDGKWQETKLRIYGDSAGTIKYDTTYTKPFTTSDYLQFYSNGSCTMSYDHYYYPNIDNYPKTPQLVPVIVSPWKYSLVGGSTYVFFQENVLLNPGGFTTNDTLRVLSTHTLWLHSVFYSHLANDVQIMDSYYEK